MRLAPAFAVLALQQRALRFGGFLAGDGPGHFPGHTTLDLAVENFGERWGLKLTATNVTNDRYLLDDEIPSEENALLRRTAVALQVRYRLPLLNTSAFTQEKSRPVITKREMLTVPRILPALPSCSRAWRLRRLQLLGEPPNALHSPSCNLNNLQCPRCAAVTGSRTQRSP